MSKKVLITVKTYPTLSRKYGETVCTAGLLEDGTWVRIYPVPFRRLEDKQQYSKFDWIECDLVKSRKYPRPESYHPADPKQLTPIAHMDTSNNWRERRDHVLKRTNVYKSLKNVIQDAKENKISLAVFKPKTIDNFGWNADTTKEWDPKKLGEMRSRYRQNELFEDNSWRRTFDVIPKLPYNFYYQFTDIEGKRSRMQILDWEIGALYWKCLRSSKGNEKIALEKVKKKYFDTFTKLDTHFFFGTTWQFHSIAPNPWVVIGVFYIPKEQQFELF